MADLHSRVHRGAYRAWPSRRVYIPKSETGWQRPLGVAALEDKIVQQAVVTILKAIYRRGGVSWASRTAFDRDAASTKRWTPSRTRSRRSV